MKKILYCGSEVVPFAATGGLGDVLGALPQALKNEDPSLDVRVVMPLYSKIDRKWREMMTFLRWIMVPFSWRREYCGIFELKKDGVTYYFLDNERYFNRYGLYGENDDGERFSFFSYAVLEMMAAVDFFPDIFHANDWQTACAVIALKTSYSGDERYRGIKAVYTVHNIDYQGKYDMAILYDVFGFGDGVRSIVEFDGAINLTKGAIEVCDAVTTVSPRYSEEIKNEPTACGLSSVLQRNAYKLSGIINGIDQKINDPATDPSIPQNFSSDDLSGKEACKTELRRRFNLTDRKSAPIIAMVTRLAEHKGIDLVSRVADEFLGDNVQFVLLGTGERKYEDFFSGLAVRHRGDAGVALAFDRELSKLIYAGADMFLMPSKSEACGLAQMMASRYGTVPIVHEVGGLYDTIKPYYEGEGNGFTFAAYNAHDMLYVIRQAEAVFKDKRRWNPLVRRIMKIDFSWSVSAKKYISLYDAMTR